MQNVRLGLALALLATLAGDAQASISIATNAQRPALRVDAKGNAEVSWTADGRRQTLVVPPTGLYRPGALLAGPDVSRVVTAPALPFAQAVRRAPDGTLYALQAWRVKAGGPVELHFARWKGSFTAVTLASKSTPTGELLVGRATFQGKPVAGYSHTNSGIRYRIYAYLDCFGCPQPQWRRIAGVAPRADGEFRLLVQPEFQGSRYRVTIAGPNIGRTLAPDASAVAPTSR